MCNVVQHFIQGKRLPIVEERLRERKDGKERGRNLSIGAERSRSVLTNFVECRRIEGSDLPQLAEQFTSRID